MPALARRQRAQGEAGRHWMAPGRESACDPPGHRSSAVCICAPGHAARHRGSPPAGSQTCVAAAPIPQRPPFLQEDDRGSRFFRCRSLQGRRPLSSGWGSAVATTGARSGTVHREFEGRQWSIGRSGLFACKTSPHLGLCPFAPSPLRLVLPSGAGRRHFLFRTQHRLMVSGRGACVCSTAPREPKPASPVSGGFRAGHTVHIRPYTSKSQPRGGATPAKPAGLRSERARSDQRPASIPRIRAPPQVNPRCPRCPRRTSRQTPLGYCHW